MYFLFLLSLWYLSLSLVAGAPAPVRENAVVDIEARGTTYPSVSGRLFNIAGKTQYFSGKWLLYTPQIGRLIM